MYGAVSAGAIRPSKCWHAYRIWGTTKQGHNTGLKPELARGICREFFVICEFCRGRTRPLNKKLLELNLGYLRMV